MLQLAKFHTMLQSGGLPTLARAISETGLSTNCKLILDAGDSLSYSSGQSWLDRSGNGYDFLRGPTTGAETNDPTFNGTAGGASQNDYWSFDGADFFTYDTTNEAWMETLHKDGAVFSMLAAVYVVNMPDNRGLFGTNGFNNARQGASLVFDSSEKMKLHVSNGSVSSLTVTADSGLSQSAWHIIGVSINENGGGVSFFYDNGSYVQVSASNTFNAAYSSPGSGSASNTMQVGAAGDNDLPLESGQRLGFFAMWQGTALSKANFDSLYGALRSRYGLT